MITGPHALGRFCLRYYTTVDGRNPANQLRLVVYPIMFKVLYIYQVVQYFINGNINCHLYTDTAIIMIMINYEI